MIRYWKSMPLQTDTKDQRTQVNLFIYLNYLFEKISENFKVHQIGDVVPFSHSTLDFKANFLYSAT